VKGELPERPTVLIFMGVAGSGKTTVAKLFAKKTGAIFYEGDDFHPQENVAKMRAGIPLTDADRKKWMKTLKKIVYRATLAAGDARVKFVHLTSPPDLIEERLKSRRGHFMPPALLASQLAILEPSADALTFSCKKTPKKIVAELIQTLGIAVSD